MHGGKTPNSRTPLIDGQLLRSNQSTTALSIGYIFACDQSKNLHRKRMSRVTKYNLRKDDVMHSLDRIGGDIPHDGIRLRAIYSSNGQEWKFLSGRCYDNSTGEEDRSDVYPSYAFISLKLESKSYSQVVSELSDIGLVVHSDFPVIKSEEHANWRDSLIPSCVSRNETPVRVFSVGVEKDAQFWEGKLIGYGLPFHDSAQKYIGEFLEIGEFYGGQDARKGEFVVEACEKRGKIVFRMNAITIDSSASDLCIVGRRPGSLPVVVNSTESLEITSQDLRDSELWLVSENEEVIDFISESEAPLRNDESPEVDYYAIVKRGESEHCEFKSYIALGANKNDKVDELLKAACALSNLTGGHIFVGVTDDAEICGIEKAARGDYKTDEDSALAFYEQDVEKQLREGLEQNQCFVVRRIHIAGKSVLIITIIRSKKLNSILASRSSYIRRGASSVRMLPEDILLHGRDSLLE